MRSTDRLRGLAGPMVLIIGLAVAGCSATPQAQPPPSAPPKQFNVTQVNRISTLAELTKRSTAVIVGVAKQSTTTEIRGIPVTVTEMVPARTVAGQAPAGSVRVSQLGSGMMTSTDVAKLMSVGGTYLIFLSEEKSDGVRRTVVTGADGLYELQGDQYRYAGGQGSSLPGSLPAGSIDTRIKTGSKK